MFINSGRPRDYLIIIKLDMHKSLLTLCLGALLLNSTFALTGGDVVKIVAGIMDGVIHKDDLQVLQ